jgi:hypothetical protein
MLLVRVYVQFNIIILWEAGAFLGMGSGGLNTPLRSDTTANSVAE